MSVTWNGAEAPPLPRPTLAQRLRRVARAAAMVLTTYFLMIFVLAFNLAERWWPLGVAQRIVRLWGRICLWLCGVRIRVHGTPMPHHGAFVSNHVGWIDIFTHLSAQQVYFVSKAEVAGWPVVGILSRQIDPVYIERRRTGAREHRGQLRARLDRGHRLCFFPEGTSSDGRQVLPFRSTLFSALTEASEMGASDLWVQPMTLDYHPPAGLPDSFYGWWGEMDFASHIAAVLALSSGGVVDVSFHAPVAVGTRPDRKALAAACEAEVRAGLTAGAASEAGRVEA